MTEQKKQEKKAESIDCRTCQHFKNLSGRCQSPEICVLAALYKPKPFIQMWSVPKS